MALYKHTIVFISDASDIGVVIADNIGDGYGNAILDIDTYYEVVDKITFKEPEDDSM